MKSYFLCFKEFETLVPEGKTILIFRPLKGFINLFKFLNKIFVELFFEKKQTPAITNITKTIIYDLDQKGKLVMVKDPDLTGKASAIITKEKQQ